MPAAFTVRDATPEDIPAVLGFVRGLADFEGLLREATATEADFHRLMFGPKRLACAALAEIGGRAVGGVLWYYSLSSFAGRPKLFVEDVFVEPPQRGSGIGLALFRHVARRAVAEGCWGMEWRVLNWNEPAIGFYRRIGARPVTDWTTQQLRGNALRSLASGETNG
jgi:GNAT superfamily N-acetyltransferase